MNLGSEAANRLARVAKLVEVTPLGLDPQANADNVASLEAATPAERALYARKYAGFKTPPSDATWTMFCQAVRARITPANGNAGDPAEHITRGG